jgi:hypothetical protein
MNTFKCLCGREYKCAFGIDDDEIFVNMIQTKASDPEKPEAAAFTEADPPATNLRPLEVAERIKDLGLILTGQVINHLRLNDRVDGIANVLNRHVEKSLKAEERIVLLENLVAKMLDEKGE